MLTDTVLNAAVLGSPVAHSLSPVLHGAAYRALGLVRWRYAAHDVDEAALLPFVAGLDETWRGLSLTMPLKEAGFDVAADVSPTARATGSVNTLVRRDTGEWDAHNTDVHGIVAALSGATSPRPTTDGLGSATVLGSGATARSAVAALVRLGVSRVRLAVRASARASTVRLAADLGVTVEQVPLWDWAVSESPGQPALVVSTLPPAAGGAAAEAIRGRNLSGTLLDVVYAGWPTPLARAAADAGMDVVSGLDMLVHQAGEQVRLMTGHEAPLEVMFAAAREAVG
ncbi:shikimate dehydrogenase [Knoellia sp. p5-6-4]|uniref:shikimate dehydrogenase n=1 Tax=unclassified Knoellia TaxID=2618719 RepID=UPI0031F37184